jgi:predicted dehydrogenase
MNTLPVPQQLASSQILSHQKIENNSSFKRIALVGCGGRGIAMFAKPLKDFNETSRLVAVCDINQGRIDYLKKTLDYQIPGFLNFDKMLSEVKPDTVIVCTKDSVHHTFIIRALEFGCDVITEKPMTIDEEKCRLILEAEKKSGKKVLVTFNYRFSPYVTKIKELIKNKSIGKVLSIDFNYQLDRVHGADYFRRWHRQKENSGGLLVHKSTHHFDLVNWFLEQEPAEVFALGSRQFYGPTRKERGVNCRSCDHRNSCEFYFDIHSPTVVGSLLDTSALYAKTEHFDGYIRDQCVFSEEIDIEDTMNVLVRYSGGTQLSYSLNAHCTYEGWKISFNGTEGRLEASHWSNGPFAKEEQVISIIRPNAPLERIEVPIVEGGHGGGDERILKMLFGEPQPDPLNHMANSHAGVVSVLTGVAANKSISTKGSIKISDLLKS